MALTTDSNPRACALDPRAGTALVLAESLSNLACVGAEAVAVVNCLNFGNPEHPEVMWQLSEAVDGLAEACRAFGLPVVGGNVSLYNESAGRDIDPTAVLGVLGLVERLVCPAAGDPRGRRRRVWCSWARAAPLRADRTRWPPAAGPPRCAPGAAAPWHRSTSTPTARSSTLVAALVAETVSSGRGPCSGVHDVSGGGLAVALAEMVARAAVGAVVGALDGHGELFSELPSRWWWPPRTRPRSSSAPRTAGVPAAVSGAPAATGSWSKGSSTSPGRRSRRRSRAASPSDLAATA